MHLFDNSLATILLCSPLALSPGSRYAPLDRKEWQALLSSLAVAHAVSVGALLDLDERQMAELPAVDVALAERLAALLARRAQAESAISTLEEAGMWIMTAFEPDYPAGFTQRLRERAPLVLFGAGDIGLNQGRAIAVVGSRDVTPSGERFARRLGELCAADGLLVVSGAARGVDRLAMSACLETGGSAIGIVADSLAKTAASSEIQQALNDHRLCLMSPYLPDAPFSAGNAMGRNKLIYALANFAIVVDSARERGGTWNGAIENLSRRWVPMFVRSDSDAAPGNSELLRRGGLPLATNDLAGTRSLLTLLDSRHNELARDEAPDSTVQQQSDTVALVAELLEFLRLPRKVAEVAAHLDISIARARNLLTEAVIANQVIVVAKHPATYQIAANGRAGDLFSSGK
ncbi:MAG: DNA-protecting protein DprA [candidate division Zixibacteria bacterium]|nr:DNA-protecting protein DprA [candidate division Zixibacteria bacterium]